MPTGLFGTYQSLHDLRYIPGFYRKCVYISFYRPHTYNTHIPVSTGLFGTYQPLAGLRYIPGLYGRCV